MGAPPPAEPSSQRQTTHQRATGVENDVVDVEGAPEFERLLTVVREQVGIGPAGRPAVVPAAGRAGAAGIGLLPHESHDVDGLEPSWIVDGTLIPVRDRKAAPILVGADVPADGVGQSSVRALGTGPVMRGGAGRVPH